MYSKLSSPSLVSSNKTNIHQLGLSGVFLLVFSSSVDAACTTNITNSTNSTASFIIGASNVCFANSSTISNTGDNILLLVSGWSSLPANISGIYIYNTGRLSSASGGIYVDDGAIVSELNNSGSLIVSYSASTSYSVYTDSITGVDVDYGVSSGTNYYSQINLFSNSGSIQVSGGPWDAAGVSNNVSETIQSFLNSGSIEATSTDGYSVGVFNDTNALITTFTNSGSISATSTNSIAAGIYNSSGTIGTLINSGSITGTSTYSTGYGIYNTSGSITTLTNSGSITGTTYSIENTGGTIGTLTNYQGGNSSTASNTALTYTGNLPSNYYAFVTSTTHYGQLSVTSPSGSMTFGIDSGSTLARNTYSNVLTGVSSSSITGVSGTFNGLNWKLVEYDNSNHYWNLVVLPSSDNTLTALSTNSSLIKRALNSRSMEITNSAEYDCGVFGQNNWCLSYQARYSAWDNNNDGAGVFAGSYKLTDKIYLGAFVDYRLSSSSSAKIRFSDDAPSLGGFLGYQSNSDGTGLNLKASTALNHGNAKITRDSSLSNTEAGYGTTKLSSRMVSGEISWGALIGEAIVASPFAGLLYTKANRHGYTEDTVSGTVDYPLTFNDYSQGITTGKVGTRLKGSLFEKFRYQLGVGIEYDLNRQFSSFSGSSDIDGLTAFSLSTKDSSKRIRGVGMVGIHYQLGKTHALTSNIILREQPYSSHVAISMMGGYQVAF